MTILKRLSYRDREITQSRRRVPRLICEKCTFIRTSPPQLATGRSLPIVTIFRFLCHFSLGVWSNELDENGHKSSYMLKTTILPQALIPLFTIFHRHSCAFTSRSS